MAVIILSHRFHLFFHGQKTDMDELWHQCQRHDFQAENEEGEAAWQVLHRGHMRTWHANKSLYVSYGCR